MDFLCAGDDLPISPEDLDKVEEFKDFIARSGNPSSPPWPLFNGDIKLLCPNLHEREKYFVRVHPDGKQEIF